MIKFFCYQIPRVVSQPMFTEYNNRMTEVKYLLGHKSYSNLHQHIELIELLLAMSVFYKRVITNLDSATKFSNTVFNTSEAEYVKIGTYKMTPQESKKINAIVQNFIGLLQKFKVPNQLITYSETKEFLREVNNYKKACERREKNI